jgi:hypothetical protein
MKSETALNWRSLFTSALILSLNIMVHAQGNEAIANLDDTSKYVPYRIMQGS